MRVFVTGSKGFVGGWLTKEAVAAGHQALDAPSIDVTDRGVVARTLADVRPDAIVHLAAVAFAPDAAADQQTAFAVAIGGTVNVFEAACSLDRPPIVLVSGSSEVYGVPDTRDLPLTESSPLAPATPYALSKAAQESVALAYAARFGLKVVVTRSFSHTGPGQRDSFVVPALAHRVRAVAEGQAQAITVGNLDVKRDMTDVRDVVKAYRLLLESAARGEVGAGGTVVNVCSGRAVSIRSIVTDLCHLAHIEPSLSVDPSLVRNGDAQEIRGDPSAIEQLVGWRATTPWTQTLADVWAATTLPVGAAAT